MDPGKIYHGIQAIIGSQNYKAAEWALEKMLASFPDHASAHHDLGACYAQRGDRARALEQYEEAARLQPKNVVFQKSLADFYHIELGRKEDALKVYLNILSLHPKDINTLLIISDICVSLGKFDTVKAFCLRVLGMEPWNTKARDLFCKVSEGKHSAVSSRSAKKIAIDDKNSMKQLHSNYTTKLHVKERYSDKGNLRILLCVASSGVHNHPYTIKMLEEFAGMPYVTHVVVRGMEIMEYPPILLEKLKIRHIRHPNSEGYRMTFFHRCDVLFLQDEYDLFIYTEHDQLITKRNIDAYLAATRELPDDVIAGFLRYGYRSEDPYAGGEKYLIDLYEHAGFKPFEDIEDPWVEINGKRYFTTKNRHQGCWLLTREQLKRAIASEGFVASWHGGPYGVSEQACSDPYTQCGFRIKVIPYDDLDSFLIHHMPKRYTETGMPLVMLRSYLNTVKKPSTVYESIITLNGAA